MIKKIVIDDFQSWEHLELEPSPNLSVIVGMSNQGKTGIARALSACIYGEWDTSWTRFGKPFCKITVILDNGVSVTRRKGPKVNEYVLKIPNCEDQTFSSIGVGVPEPIQRALNMYKVSITPTESLNLGYASQLDSLFMLGGSKSFNAKILGVLTGADVLDVAIQSINKDKRQLTAEKQSKELELVDLQAQIDKLAAVEAFEEQIAAIEQKLVSLALAEQRVSRIAELFRRVKALKANWVVETEKEALLSQVNLSNVGLLAQRVDKIKRLVMFCAKKKAYEDNYHKQNLINNLLTPIDISVIPVLAEKAVSFKTS